jgi:hypothetical protein
MQYIFLVLSQTTFYFYVNYVSMWFKTNKVLRKSYFYYFALKIYVAVICTFS